MVDRIIAVVGRGPCRRRNSGSSRLPHAEGRWFPLSHSHVLSVVTQNLADAGFLRITQQLGIDADGGRFFGTLVGLTRQRGYGPGRRHPQQRRQVLPARVLHRPQTFVCDNLAFRSGLLVRRKHTINGERDFGRSIFEAVGSLESFRRRKPSASSGWRSGERGRCPHPPHRSTGPSARERPRVLQRHWRNPPFEEFQARNKRLWRLLNAFTAAMKERATQRHVHAVQTIRLDGLLSPSVN